MDAGQVRTCGWCATRKPPLVLVGIHEAGAGPGRSTYACRPCMDRLRIVPLSEHPCWSLGAVRYRQAVR
jgi:hypothetical protein